MAAGKLSPDRRPRARQRSAGSAYAVKVVVNGRVQGVGFRPFVYRLAREFDITGYVQNCLGDVEIVARGRPADITAFSDALVRRAPPLSRPCIIRSLPIESHAFEEFRILDSDGERDAEVFVPPDYYLCSDCSRELEDPGDRRFGYPFINCTQCGPRYTLITALPYDRPNTSMAGFPLCADCENEYRDPANRRFHAEPVACPACGPGLDFRAPGCEPVTDNDRALQAAVELLVAGGIVAVKGIGGYHILCDARNDDAIARLRTAKQRPGKPFAVMFPLAGNDGLDRVRECVALHDAEAAALVSPERPIVLATKREDAALSPLLAPGLRELGVFLPYSPLHHLLLRAFGGPLVATSGNLSGEPVQTDNDEAERRLGGIADAQLHHTRPIVRPADDPVRRRIADVVRPLRHGRGSAPTELPFPGSRAGVTLAVGAHMKGTVALCWDGRAVVSPHIGEMGSTRSIAVFEKIIADLQALYGIRADRIVCDAHPGYTTHRWARRSGLPVETVAHHEAHASALAGEYGGGDDWLVFTWDGVGLGKDGTLWGGEAMAGRSGAWQRVASLRPFRLVGGERAGREPWRSAAGLLWACGLDWMDVPDPDGLAKAAWKRRLNAPVTSAAGRLFDAAAALILGQTHASFEAEGPMRLESLCSRRREPLLLDQKRDTEGVLRADWAGLLAPLRDESLPAAVRAEIFHASMARVLLDQALRLRDDRPVRRVGLCGGVFQNRVLTEHAIELLEANDFMVCLPERLPANDAAISFGQAVESDARSL